MEKIKMRLKRHKLCKFVEIPFM